jgi:hypothetical protein
MMFRMTDGQNPQVSDKNLLRRNVITQGDADALAHLTLKDNDEISVDFDLPAPVAEEKIIAGPNACMAFFVGGLVSGVQIGAGYLVSTFIPGGKEFMAASSPLLTDGLNTANASFVTRKMGELYQLERNKIERYVVQPVLHLAVATSLAAGYRAAVTTLGGDVDDPAIIPATIALQGIVAPVVEQMTEKVYFGTKFLLFKSAGAVRSLCDKVPEEPSYQRLGPGGGSVAV